jgi:hypothetical protein
VRAVDLWGNGRLYYLIIRCWCSGRPFPAEGTSYSYFETRGNNGKSQKLCHILYPIVNKQYAVQIVCNPQLVHFSGQNQGHSFTRTFALLCANRACEDELSRVISAELDTVRGLASGSKTDVVWMSLGAAMDSDRSYRKIHN